MALAVLVTSRIRLKGTIRSIVFFPVLVSFVAVGITFKVMMHPTKGLINRTIDVIGFTGPKWLTDPQIALLSVALVDVWKGVGLAMVIFIAGIVSIPSELLESVSVDGGSAWARFRHVILPLSKPATFTVILLSFIGGLRSFDLIWTMTGGGPGLHHRRARLDDLQELPGRLLRPVDGRQRDPVPPRHRHRLPVELVPAQAGADVMRLIRATGSTPWRSASCSSCSSSRSPSSP